jgi:glycosyltransferase involved in cell wall biosynthesis
MKIMTVMYTFKRGGSYERFKMMLEAFIERACEVHCLSLTPIPITHPLYYNHILTFPRTLQTGLLSKLVILFLFPFYSLLVAWRERIEIFIAFGSLYAFVQAIPKLFLKKPMVTLIRGNSTFGLKMRDSSKSFLWFNKMIEYLGLLSSDRIITVNASIQEEIIKRIRRKKNVPVNVLHNDIPSMPISIQKNTLNVRTQFGIPEGVRVLVTAGVITRGKNIETLIKCLQKIGMNNLFLLVAGDVSTKSDFYYQNYLKELTKALGLGKKVIFTGWIEREKLWKIFLCADLFVLPSKNEGMPNAMLEALRFDLPCLGSKIPGIIDILHYEELMFDPLNEQAVALKIEQAFSDSLFLNKIKKLCQERKQAFVFDWKERVFQNVTKGIQSATIH